MSELNNANERLLWLVPNTPENVSVGRERIAETLESRGYDVTIQQANKATARTTLLSADYDAIIGTTRAGALLAMLLSIRHNIPYIVDHVDPISQFYQTDPLLAPGIHMGENIAFARAEAVVYVYPEERKRVSRYAKHSVKTTLGVPYEQFKDAPANTVHVPEPVCIYCGSLEPIYHIDELVKTFAQTDEMGLVVLGSGSEQDVVKQAADENSNIQYVSSVPHHDVPKWLHGADIGINLVQDPHTVSVLEFMAAGLPVVTGTVPAKLPGVTATKPDVESITSAIKRVNGDENSKSRQAYASQHDYKSVASDYETVLQEVTV